MHTAVWTFPCLVALAACQQAPPPAPTPELAPPPVAQPEPATEPVAEQPAPAFALPEDPIAISVHQREREAVPGSQGTLYVALGDITVGQVMLSMENARGDTLVDARSVRNGDVLEFPMGGTRHYLQVVKLHNSLFNGDIAELRISTTEPEPLPPEENKQDQR